MKYKNNTKGSLHIEGHKILGPNQEIELSEEDLKKPHIKDLVYSKSWLTVAIQDLGELVFKEEVDHIMHQPEQENINVNINIPKTNNLIDYEENEDEEENLPEVKPSSSYLEEYKEAEKRANAPTVHGGESGIKHADKIPMTLDDVAQIQEENNKKLEKKKRMAKGE